MQTPETLWYFGYGSNMSAAIFRERRGMKPLAVRWGWLASYALRFNLPIGPGERGVANVEPEPGGRVCGVLYLLTPTEFDRLDRTEAVHRGLYQRIAVEVLAEGTERISAYTYRSQLTTAETRKPSMRYMGLLLEGAREHGLPEEYLDFLNGFELAVDERSES